METENQYYKMTDNYDLRFMAGTYVLMPIGTSLTDDQKLPFIINDVTAFILEQLQHKSLTERELLVPLLKEYSVGEQEAEETLTAVLEQMVSKTVLEETVI